MVYDIFRLNTPINRMHSLKIEFVSISKLWINVLNIIIIYFKETHIFHILSVLYTILKIYVVLPTLNLIRNLGENNSGGNKPFIPFYFRLFRFDEKYQAISKMFSRINALCYLVPFIYLFIFWKLAVCLSALFRDSVFFYFIIPVR